jgi:hypothetical protein
MLKKITLSAKTHTPNTRKPFFHYCAHLLLLLYKYITEERKIIHAQKYFNHFRLKFITTPTIYLPCTLQSILISLICSLNFSNKFLI